jgi:hypothetical protein
MYLALFTMEHSSMLANVFGQIVEMFLVTFTSIIWQSFPKKAKKVANGEDEDFSSKGKRFFDLIRSFYTFSRPFWPF